MKLLRINDRKEFFAQHGELSYEQRDLANTMVREVSEHYIDNPAYRSLCIEVKQLVRDLELVRVLYLSDDTRARKIALVAPFCADCETKHRLMTQTVLENEIVRIKSTLDAMLEYSSELNKERKVVYAIADVNTAS